MTASLPPERLEAIRKTRPDLNVIDGPSDLECLRRYAPRLSDAVDVFDAVRATIAKGGKVLWVRNRVTWANQTFADCRKTLPAVVVEIYHSRFRYRDRSRRHRRVIDAFKKPGCSAVLVATQVAEMSLDLSADLLVSDIAPIPALIQRMGRLNRYWMPGERGEPKPALFIPVNSSEAKPYRAEDLAAAQLWLERLTESGKPVSQRELSEGFERVGQGAQIDIRRAEKNAEFISGVWETRVGQTREQGNTISVLLDQDWTAWRNASREDHPSREWLREHEVSIPLRQEVLDWMRERYLPIAPSSAIRYDWDDETGEGTGAEWN